MLAAQCQVDWPEFPHLRKLVLLENVKNILSPSLRSLWNYVIEALLNVREILF